MDFLREKPLDRRASAGWGIRFPPHMHPGAAREALTLLLRAGVPPDAILRIFQAFGVAFADKSLFADKVEDHRIDLFRILGMAVALGAIFAFAVLITEFAFAAAEFVLGMFMPAFGP